MYKTYTKYNELPEIKTLIDQAKADLATAETVEVAETVVTDAQDDLLAKVKEYISEELESAYNSGSTSGYVLTEEQHLLVQRKVKDSNNISDVIKAYEDAMDNRISADEYDLFAKQKAATDELDSYIPSEKLNKDVTLGTVLEEEITRIKTEAKADVEDVTVPALKANPKAIDDVVTDAKAEIDAIYAFANKRASDKADLQEKYEDELTALKANANNKISEEDMEALKAELLQVLNDAKAELDTFKSESAEYTQAVTNSTSKLDQFVELVEAKIDAKKYLDDKFNGYKTGSNKDKLTAKDLEKLQNDVTTGKEAIDVATIVGSQNTDAGSVMKAKKDAEDKMTLTYNLIVSIISSREDITNYVQDITATTLKISDTEKYITAIQSTIDSELNKLDEITSAEGINFTTERVKSRKNIYEALRTSLVELLDRYVNLSATNSEKLLDMTSYKARETTKTSLTAELQDENDYKDNGDLSTLITSFESNANLVSVNAARDGMKAEFAKDADVVLLDKIAVGSTGNVKYNQLTAIKGVIEAVNNSFDKCNSYGEYEEKVTTAKNNLVEAVKTDLDTLLNSKLTGTQLVDALAAVRVAYAEKSIKDMLSASEKWMLNGSSVLETTPEKMAEIDPDLKGEKPLWGKDISDIQSNLAIDNTGKVTGTLKSVSDMAGGFDTSKSSHYICLTISNPNAKSYKIELKGGKKPTEGNGNYQSVVYQLNEKDTSINIVTVTWYSEANYGGTATEVIYDMTGLTLAPEA